MSTATETKPQTAPPAFPFAALLEMLAELGITVERDGDRLIVTDAGQKLTPDTRELIQAHKPALLALCDTRAEFARLHDYIVRLRCEDLPKTPRADALGYLARQVALLAARCDLPGGYRDAGDPFAASALDALRGELREVEEAALSEAGPYPLGALPQDPFAEGRLFNGKRTAGTPCPEETP